LVLVLREHHREEKNNAGDGSRTRTGLPPTVFKTFIAPRHILTILAYYHWTTKLEHNFWSISDHDRLTVTHFMTHLHLSHFLRRGAK
ncbi:MAG: hypothetical protein AAGF95_35150, partial [Chloroflexota bacterium]